MKFLRILIPVIAIFILAGCGQGSKESRTGFSNAQKEIKPIPVMVEKVETANLEEYISFTAKLEGITDIYFTSESSGKVVELNKHLGDWINQGEALAKLENDSYLNQLDQAKANLLAAEASLELAEMQYNTMKKLFEQSKVSRSEFVTSQSGYKQAQSGYESAKALVKQSELTVKNSEFTAPVSGYISDLNLEIGAYVSMGMQVCRIVDNSRLKIKTGIGEQDVRGIEKGQKVSITYNGSGEEIEGMITGVGIAPVNGSVNYPVEIELNNQDNNLLPGMVVSGEILRRSYQNVVYTSVNNLIKIYDDYVVYVINRDNRAEQRKVVTGKQIERNIVILSGLNPGDQLVIEGANSLSDNSLVEIKQ